MVQITLPSHAVTRSQFGAFKGKHADTRSLAFDTQSEAQLFVDAVLQGCIKGYELKSLDLEREQKYNVTPFIQKLDFMSDLENVDETGRFAVYLGSKSEFYNVESDFNLVKGQEYKGLDVTG